MALAESHKLALTVGIVLVAILVLSCLLYDAWSKHKETVTANDKLDRKIKKLKTEKVAKISEKQQKFAALKAGEPVYRGMFPPEKEGEALTDFLEYCRKKTKVLILSIEEKRQPTAARRRAKSAVQRYTYEISMMGTYDQFCEFVSMLEAHGHQDYLRFIKVDKFKMKKDDEDENVINLNDIKLTISMASYAEPVRKKPPVKKKDLTPKGGAK